MYIPYKNTLTLRQAYQARTDFALIDSNLELIMTQLARMPTRAYLCRTKTWERVELKHNNGRQFRKR